MQQMFNSLDGLYLWGICLNLDIVMKNQLRKQVVAEIEKLNRGKKYRNKRNEGKSKAFFKRACFVNKTNPTS